MLLLAPAAEPLVRAFSSAFTRPTYQRFVLLLVGVIITSGRRTVSRVLWTVRSLVDGNPSSYHRFFSQARWSLWPVAKVLVLSIAALVPEDEPIVVAGDDTVAEHNGKKIYGKACHRDAVRSGRGWTVRKWGHRWVVLSILVKLRFASRRWALPVLCALYLPPHMSKNQALRHKVPSQLAQSLLAALMHWLPQKKFIFLGDGHFSGHELADFASRHRHRLTLIGRLRAKACLYERPPRRRGSGRPRHTGCKLPSPAQQVAAAKHRKLTVRWYGNTRRRVSVVSGVGIWCRRPLRSAIRWVYVHDPISERSDYFYSTNQKLSPRRIIEMFAARWSLEVTFQEMKQHLGLESTPQRTRRSVLRAAPCLMGCFSVITLIYNACNRNKPALPRQTLCHHKSQPTFSDALFTVRKLLWGQTVLQQALGIELATKLPRQLKTFVLNHLAEAA
jgi:DDE superfamily endonuclease